MMLLGPMQPLKQCMALIALSIIVPFGQAIPLSMSMLSSICGKSILDPATTRIVGGTKARDGAWPWLVILTEDDHPMCAGAILNERFILTATHCFIEGNNQTSRWKVLAGKLRLDRFEIGQKKVKVERIIMHTHFTASTVANDIALVEMADALTFTTRIKPICLPGPKDVPLTGEMCLLAGWGDTHTSDFNDKLSLNQVALPVISDGVCGLPSWYGSDFLPQTTFCAGYEQGGKDACNGDSGAPLVCQSKDKWVVKGITSWAYECGIPRWPGIYTDVTKYLPWIHRHIDPSDIVVG